MNINALFANFAFCMAKGFVRSDFNVKQEEKYKSGVDGRFLVKKKFMEFFPIQNFSSENENF